MSTAVRWHISFLFGIVVLTFFDHISPGDSRTLSGIMNTAENLGGVVSPSWTLALDFAALKELEWPCNTCPL